VTPAGALDGEPVVGSPLEEVLVELDYRAS